jgi:flagellar biosynthesis/type III secretory pathway M-ring protein FliF/YscJ
MKAITNPTFLAIAAVMVCVFALTVYGQQPATQTSGLTADTFFKWFGYVGVTLAAVSLAAAAIFGLWKNQALKEARELARTRKERLLDLGLDNTNLRSRIRDLEKENENLEKKNLRLQDEAE